MVLRYRWLLLITFAAISAAGTTHFDFGDWPVFPWGADLLLGQHHRLPGTTVFPVASGGLHTYANYHLLQFGPTSLLLSVPLKFFGWHQGRVAAVVFCEACGLGFLRLAEKTCRIMRPGQDDRTAHATVLVGGFLFLGVWAEVSGRWTHLDDALAVIASGAACWAIARRRPALTGVMIGLAFCSKTWAVGLIPLVLVFERRDRLRSALAALAVFALAWGPFIIADSGTLSVGNFGIYTQPPSALAALGVPSRTLLAHPSAWRAGQFALEAVLVLVLVKRRSWVGALLVCFAARLLVDPQALSYYPASAVAGALLFDLLYWRRPLPIATGVASLAWVVDMHLGRDQQAVPHLIIYATLVAIGLVAAGRGSPRSTDGSARPAAGSHELAVAAA